MVNNFRRADSSSEEREVEEQLVIDVERARSEDDWGRVLMDRRQFRVQLYRHLDAHGHDVQPRVTAHRCASTIVSGRRVRARFLLVN